MHKTLDINGESYIYEPVVLSYGKTKPMSLESGKLLLRSVDEIFRSIDLPFYLCYGTLLGAIREKSLIKNDEDLDVFINKEKLLYSKLPFLKLKGLELIRYVPNIVYSFRMNDDGYIDVYILHELKWYNPWSFYCFSLESKIQPKKYFMEYEQIDFWGVKCMCPKNPESLLAFWYGDDWRTPVNGHNFCYEVKTAYYWHNFKNKVLKKLIFYEYWYRFLK